MATITVEIPQNVRLLPNFDISVYLAAKLYEDAILSAGQAAALAHLSKRVFIELMGKYGISPFSTSVEDLLEDIKNA
jgi:predicted HTH domain antitoxin